MATSEKDYSFVLIDTVKTKENVRAVSKCPTGAITGGRGFLRHWLSTTGTINDLLIWDVSVTVTAIAVVSDNDVWTGLAKGDILIYDLGSKDVKKKPFFGHKDGVTCIQAFPTPPKTDSAAAIISGGSDFLVKLWSRSGEQLAAYSGHANHIHCLATRTISESSHLILSGSAHGAVLATMLQRSSDNNSFMAKTESVPLPACAKAVTSILEHKEKFWVGYDHGLVRVCDHLIAEEDGLSSLQTTFAVRVELQSHKGRISSIEGIGNAVWTGSADHRIIAWDAHKLGRKLFELGDQGAFISCMAPIDWMMWIFLKDRAVFYTSKSLFDHFKEKEDSLTQRKEQLRLDLIQAEDKLTTKEEEFRIEKSNLQKKIESNNKKIQELVLDIEREQREKAAEMDDNENKVAEIKSKAENDNRALEEKASEEINQALSQCLNVAQDFDAFIKESIIESQKNVDSMAAIYDNIKDDKENMSQSWFNKMSRDIADFESEVKQTRIELETLLERNVQGAKENSERRVQDQEDIEALQDQLHEKDLELAKKSEELAELTTKAASNQNQSAESLLKRDQRLGLVENELKEANDSIKQLNTQLEEERLKLNEHQQKTSTSLLAKKHEVDALKAEMESSSLHHQEQQEKLQQLQKALETAESSLHERLVQRDELESKLASLASEKEAHQREMDRFRGAFAKKEQALRQSISALEDQIKSDASEKHSLSEREKVLSAAKESSEEEARQREEALLQEKEKLLQEKSVETAKYNQLSKELEELKTRHEEGERVHEEDRGRAQQDLAHRQNLLDENRLALDAGKETIDKLQSELLHVRSECEAKALQSEEGSKELQQVHDQKEELEKKLTTLQEELSARESLLLDTLKEADESHKEEVKKLQESQLAELEKTKSAHERVFQDQREVHEKALRQQENIFQEQRDKHEKEMQALQEAQSRESEDREHQYKEDLKQQQDQARVEIDKLHELLNERDESLRALEKDHLANEESSRQRIDDSASTINGLRAENDSLRKTLDAREADLKEVSDKADDDRRNAEKEATMMKDKLHATDLERESLLGTIKTLDQELNKARNESVETNQSLMDVNARLEKARLEKDKCAAELSDLSNKYEKAMKERDLLSNKVEAMGAEIPVLKNKLHDLNESCHRKDQENAVVEEKLRNMLREKEKMEEKAQTLERELDNSKVEVRQCNIKLDEEKAKVSSLERKVAEDLRSQELLQKIETESLTSQHKNEKALLQQQRDQIHQQLKDSQNELNAVLQDRFKLARKLKKYQKEINNINNAELKAVADELLALQAKYRQSRADYKLALRESSTRESKVIALSKENEALALQLESTVKSLNYFRHASSVHESDIVNFTSQLQSLNIKNVELKSFLQEATKDISVKNAKIEHLQQAIALLDKKLKRNQKDERKVMTQVKELNDSIITRQQESNDQMREQLLHQQDSLQRNFQEKLVQQQLLQDESHKRLMKQHLAEQQRLLEQTSAQRLEDIREEEDRRQESEQSVKVADEAATTEYQKNFGKMSFADVMAQNSKRPRSAADTYFRRRKDDRYKD